MRGVQCYRSGTHRSRRLLRSERPRPPGALLVRYSPARPAVRLVDQSPVRSVRSATIPAARSAVRSAAIPAVKSELGSAVRLLCTSPPLRTLEPWELPRYLKVPSVGFEQGCQQESRATTRLNSDQSPLAKCVVQRYFDASELDMSTLPETLQTEFMAARPILRPNQPPTADAMLDLPAWFGSSNPVCVELGCGYGQWISAMALRTPETNYVGIDNEWKRCTHTLGRALVNGIPPWPIDVPWPMHNLKIIRTDAHSLLLHLPDDSVDKFFVLFPDPWPKKRHAKRRILQPHVARLIATKLKPGGTMQLVTDHKEVAEWCKESVEVACDPNRIDAKPEAFVLPYPVLEQTCIEAPDTSASVYGNMWKGENRTLHHYAWQCVKRF